MQTLGQEVWALRGSLAGRHVGGLAWDRVLYPATPAETWSDEGGVVACGFSWPPATL